MALICFLMQLLQIFGSSPQVAMQIMHTKLADDLVIVAKSEREMKEMIRSLGKHVRKKKKTKMMVFNKRKRKVKRMSGSGKEGKWIE
jgi:hypothetical protein